MTWMLTLSGIRLDLANPTPDMIDFYDIATALARTERFAHHCPVEGYSVLQHSLLVASLFDDPVERRYALLHDAHEAYIGDIITPVKQFLSGISELEQRLDAAIFAKAGLEPTMPPQIRERVMDADLAVLRREVIDLIGSSPEAYGLDVPKTFAYTRPIRAVRGKDLRSDWLRLLLGREGCRGEHTGERHLEAAHVISHHSNL